MLRVERPTRDLVALVDALVAEHGADRAALLPVLCALRARRHPIDDAAMRLVAERLGVSAVEVHGVATFYAFLGTGRTGRHEVWACRTLPCVLAGARDTATALARAADCPFGGIPPDGAVSLGWASCLGLCDRPPAVLVDGEPVGPLPADDARRLVEGLRAEHEP